MFCPVGYRSAAELWHEYQIQRLKSVYMSATEAYQKHKEKFSYLRGSPLDICEFLFLSSLCEVGVCLASPRGDVSRVFIRLADGEHSLFSVLSPMRAASFAAAVPLDKACKDAINLFGQHSFSSWKHSVEERDSWINAYPQLSDAEYDEYDFDANRIWHHTLPCHFLRDSFLIADTVPLWVSERAGDTVIKPILDHYEGWSICISEETYSVKWQDYLTGKKAIFANSVVTEEKVKRGRPKLENARSAFAAMAFDKGHLSWAQVRAKILRETGERPSDKALRNWRDQARQQTSS